MTYCENIGKKILDDNKLVTIAPWWESEICLNFSSNQDTPVNVTYGFAEWFLNDRGTQLCNVNIEEPNSFNSLFSNDNGNIRTISLQPWENKTIKEKIFVPLGMSGMIYGCMLHKIEAPKWDGMFSVVAMVKRHLNIFVWWDADISKWVELLKSPWDKLSSNNKLWVRLTPDGRATLSFLVKNAGNISQNIQVAWNIYNALWFEKTFETAWVLVWPWQETEIQSESFILPSYKWFFSISMDMTATPSFSFNTDGLDPAIKEPTTISQTWKLFIFSWIWLIVWAFVLIVVVLILRPLFKKHKQA